MHKKRRTKLDLSEGYSFIIFLHELVVTAVQNQDSPIFVDDIICSINNVPLKNSPSNYLLCLMGLNIGETYE